MALELSSDEINAFRISYESLKSVSENDLAEMVINEFTEHVLATDEFYSANPLERISSWLKSNWQIIVETSKEFKNTYGPVLSNMEKSGDLDRVAILVSFLLKSIDSPFQSMPIPELTALAIIIYRTMRI